MFKNYLKIAWRNIEGNRLYSFINIGGLAIGLCACFLILFFVGHEKSYDKFHADADRIFKMRASMNMGGLEIGMEAFNESVAGMAVESSPGVVSAIRLYKEHEPIPVSNPQLPATRYSEADFSYADAGFFSFFSFRLLQGDIHNVLKDPYSVVISEAVAEKYFGTQDAIGRMLEVRKDSTYRFTVTGIVENTRSNSSIPTDFIASFNSMPTMSGLAGNFDHSAFRPGSIPTFLKLMSPGDAAAVEKNLDALAQQADPDSENIPQHFLNNITALHLSQAAGSTSRYLNIFPVIAVLILFLALVNYLSLATARASLRAREIGVRKVNGASRKSVAFQFYVESALCVFMAFACAALLALGSQPFFFNLIGIEIDRSFFLDPTFVMTLSGLLVLTIFLTGLYPAILMSSFNPIDNLRTKAAKATNRIPLRQACTVVQFVVAVGLIISGLVIHRQLSHLREVDTGLNRSDVLVLPLQATMGSNAAPLLNDVAGLPQVVSTSLARNSLYKGFNMLFATSTEQKDQTALPLYSVDEDFFRTLGVGWKIAPEDERRLTDANTLVINEVAISTFGLLPNPIGQKMTLGNEDYAIAGVTRNFNYASLDNPIDALAMFVSGKTEAISELPGQNTGFLYIKFAPGSDLQDMVAKIESMYGRYDQETPFAYEFLDDAFDATFRSEKRLAAIFNIFIVLTLVIAGMGLFGLAAFTAQQKVKEIGIRKVLGASVYQITSLLSMGYLRLVLVSIAIASPIAWYVMRDWLQDFTYRTEISWYIFVLAGVVTLGVTLVTVGFETIRAALANPVKNLHAE